MVPAGDVLKTNGLPLASRVTPILKATSMVRLNVDRASSDFVLILTPLIFRGARVPGATHELTFFQTKTDCTTACVPDLSPCATAVMG